MKCSNCGLENPYDAKFCRGCGQDLSIKENPMDKWPNLDFRPVSIVSLKQYKSGRIFFFKLFRFISWGVGLFALYLIANAFGFFVDYFNDGVMMSPLLDDPVFGRDYNIFLTLTAITFIISFLITISMYKRCPQKRQEKVFGKTVDYIQGPSFVSKTYLFFIKDHYWGCYNMKNFSIQIPATYEYLEWREYGRLLNGKKDDVSMIIDINGQPLK